MINNTSFKAFLSAIIYVRDNVLAYSALTATAVHAGTCFCDSLNSVVNYIWMQNTFFMRLDAWRYSSEFSSNRANSAMHMTTGRHSVHFCSHI
jgi:hypothetical protein